LTKRSHTLFEFPVNGLINNVCLIALGCQWHIAHTTNKLRSVCLKRNLSRTLFVCSELHNGWLRGLCFGYEDWYSLRG